MTACTVALVPRHGPRSTGRPTVHVLRHGVLCGAALCALLLAAPAPASGQDARQDIRASQLRLDSIRQERQRLQREMEQLQSRVRDASRELTNIGRQRNASAAALRELEFQAEMLRQSMDETSDTLGATQARLRARTDQLNARLRSIYKRGRLHALQVLLGAENFGDLLSRYKYLHLMTLHERRVIDDVRRLERSLADHERELRESFAQLDGLQQQRRDELAAFERLEGQHSRALQQYRQQETATAGTIVRLERDERQMAALIAEMERLRVEEERRAAAAGRSAAPAAMTTRSLGTLNWPVDGNVLYRFGPERQPNGVVLRHHGLGIAAPAGTAVRAVEAGTVTMSRPFEGYGPSVMISHGGGFYTLYLYLQTIAVRDGQAVAAGQTIGTVGGGAAPAGSRLEFRVFAPVAGASPQWVDPLVWLRTQGAR
jgi:septal ring factor EnvC (AmiA/AmiB activator)